jgi:hypothetical protein
MRFADRAGLRNRSTVPISLLAIMMEPKWYPDGIAFSTAADDLPFAVHRQIGHSNPAFKRGAGMQHRMMLNGAGNDVLPFPQRQRRALDGPVVAFAAAGGELDFVLFCAQRGATCPGRPR